MIVFLLSYLGLGPEEQLSGAVLEVAVGVALGVAIPWLAITTANWSYSIDVLVAEWFQEEEEEETSGIEEWGELGGGRPSVGRPRGSGKKGELGDRGGGARRLIGKRRGAPHKWGVK